MILTISIILGVILGAVHFWNERIYFKRKSIRDGAVSFIAGVSVAYVFLFLLPDIYEGAGYFNQWIFIMVLVGFGLVHLAEKYIYQHTFGEERLFRHKEIHFFIIFLYYFFIGIVMLTIIGQSVVKGLLFFIPLLFYAAVGRVSFSEVHSHIRELRVFRWLLVSSAILGTLLSPIITGNSATYHILLAFLTGSFFYIAIVDFIPQKEKGKPIYFLIGLTAYTALIALVWLVG